MKKLIYGFITVFLFTSPLYAFEAEVTSVIDGDTFYFDAKLLNVVVRGKCRTLHYNAPEIGEEKYRGATNKLSELIEDKTVEIKAEKADRYGRWLCEVQLPDGTNVNDVMREYLKDYPKRDIYLWMEK